MDAQPLGERENGDAERGGKVGAVMDLAVTAGEERKEAAKAGQIADVGNEAQCGMGARRRSGGKLRLDET